MKVFLVILVNVFNFAKKEIPFPMQLDPEISTYSSLYSLNIFCLSMYKLFTLIIYQTYILILNKSNFLRNLTTSVHLQIWKIYESREVFLLHVFNNTLKKILKDTFYTTNDFLACPLLTMDKKDTAWYNVLSSSFV